ncbi:MAG: hypothetical protein J6X18_06490 [Bacteroidales bacterium]|nr:hypothetical protein [Bacteroidales bacterium]
MATNNTQATNVTQPINVLDNAYPNVDINYGPYNSRETAVSTLVANEAVRRGLTVGIISNGTITEYWFKSEITGSETEEQLLAKLVQKQAEQGTTNYNDLENKPQIGDTVLTSSTTLLQIGAASADTLSSHTSNAKIHTPITYNGTTTAVTGIKLEGDKLTFTVGSNSYSFRLTEWHDVADFYVLYADMRRTNGVLQVNINGSYKDLTLLTTEELFGLSVNQYGYTVLDNANKIEVAFRDLGTLKMDYHIDSTTLNSSITAIMVLYRTSGSKSPSLDFVAADTVFSGGYLYKSGEPNKLTEDITRSNVPIGESKYTLIGYFQGNGDSLSGNTNIGINFNN